MFVFRTVYLATGRALRARSVQVCPKPLSLLSGYGPLEKIPSKAAQHQGGHRIDVEADQSDPVLVDYGRSEGVEDGRRTRTDATVVETVSRLYRRLRNFRAGTEA